MAKAWPDGAHLCCQQIGAPTLDWLANATEATASEYVGYAEGVLAAQRFLRTRKPEAALSEEGVRAAVAVHFSPLAVQACTCPCLCPIARPTPAPTPTAPTPTPDTSPMAPPS